MDYGQFNGVVFASKFAFDNNGKIYTALIWDSSQTDVAANVFRSNDMMTRSGRLKVLIGIY